MLLFLKSFLNKYVMEIVGLIVFILIILGYCAYNSHKLKSYNNTITELTKTISDLNAKNKNLNDQLEKQNEEIKTKDKFIIDDQKTIIRKNINRAASDNDVIKWLHDNRCNACKG